MLEALARRAVKLGGVALTGGDGVKLAGLAHDVHRHADVDEAVDVLAGSFLPAFVQRSLVPTSHIHSDRRSVRRFLLLIHSWYARFTLALPSRAAADRAFMRPPAERIIPAVLGCWYGDVTVVGDAP